MKRLIFLVFAAALMLCPIAGCGFMPLGTPAHTGAPVIIINTDRIMAGSFDEYFLYDDGWVIANFSRNLRINTLFSPPYRSWKIGKIGREDISDLFLWIRESDYKILKDTYSWSELRQPPQAQPLFYRVSVSWNEIFKRVVLDGYPDIEYLPPTIKEIIEEITSIKLYPVGREIIFEA